MLKRVDAAALGGDRQTRHFTVKDRPVMRALCLVKEKQLEVLDLAPPAPPAAGEVQIRIRAVALNHLDVWGFRGMAFAKRKFPLAVGAEASAEIAAIGPGV